jgi:signal transduction histidine kinase
LLQVTMLSSERFRLTLIFSLILGISLLHYLTPLHLPMLHDIFQRLYYLPIILSAFWFGFRGGLLAGVCVSVSYVPHIVFQWGGHLTMELERYLEILIYNVVGVVTGLLAEREQNRRRELEETARGLEESYQRLQEQSERIIQIEDQLRRAERLSVLGELSAVLAHEIRNPLGSIRGTAEILKDDFSPDDRKYEFVEILVKESERLNRVIEDFLRIARPQPGTMALCDLSEDLRMVTTLVASEAKGKEIALELSLVAIPPVRGDREQLRQVFLNLLLNALQATPAGGRITITAAHDERNVEILFSDTGAGISPADQEKIFDPFFTTKEGGTGLGLAVTRRIIAGHGGNIAVKSREGQGTTMKIVLPVGVEKEPS